jgi:hypothetical protein
MKILTPSPYRWSWASIDGIIHYRHSAGGFTDCVEACVSLTGSDPTGAISDAFIVLSGPTVTVQLQKAQEGFWHLTKYVLETGGKRVDFTHDCDNDFNDGSLAVGENLLGIRLGFFYCLVLQQVGIDNSHEIVPVYRRVGHSKGCHDYSGQWFLPYSTEKVSVKII